MKFDSESMYHHTCPSPEHDTKVMVHSDNPFIFAKDDHFMINMLDIDREENGDLIHTSPMEKKNFKVTSPTRQFLNLEDSLNRSRNDDEFTGNPFCAPSSGFEMVVKEDFYTDKIVTEVEALKTGDCTEDDPCHLVKDISVDKEIQCSDRNVVESAEVGWVGSSIPSQSLDNVHNDLTSAKADSVGVDDLKFTVFHSVLVNIDENQVDPASVLHDVSDIDGSFLCSFDNEHLDRSASMIADTSAKVFEADHVFVSDNDSDGKGSFVSSIAINGKTHPPESVSSNLPSEVTESTEFPVSDVHNNCVGKDFSVTSLDHGVKIDPVGVVVNIIPAEITENQSSPSLEITTDSSMVDTFSLNFMSDQRQFVDEQKSEAISEESNSISTTLSFRSDVLPASNESEEISPDCKEAGGVITFNFDREVASTSGRENKATSSSLQSEAIKNGAGTEEAIVEGPIASTKYSFLHHMQGDSNSYGPNILSGPVANSGHIPYSGSISLRSDSSTTSARSFAFPILQSEWNSSPVKMAKADRRRLRKHRSRIMGILCCRF